MLIIKKIFLIKFNIIKGRLIKFNKNKKLNIYKKKKTKFFNKIIISKKISLQIKIITKILYKIIITIIIIIIILFKIITIIKNL